MNDLQIQRAAELLQNEFGPEWQTIAGMLGTEGLRKRVGKELTSFMAFPERGNGGNSHWRKWLLPSCAMFWTASVTTAKM